MLALRILPLLLCLALTTELPARAGLKTASTEETVAEGLVLLSAEFGLIDKAEDGTITIKPTDTIPLEEGKIYGWRLRFRTKLESVSLREELQLPAAPKVWNSPNEGEGFKVSPDGRTATTEVDAELQDGVLIHAWGVAPGDPSGDHVIRVFIQGKLVRTFKFKVVPAK
jgi:hypothetical protein